MIFQVSLNGSLVEGHVFQQMDHMGVKRAAPPQAVLYFAEQRRQAVRPLPARQLIPEEFFRLRFHVDHTKDLIRDCDDLFQKTKAQHLRQGPDFFVRKRYLPLICLQHHGDIFLAQVSAGKSHHLFCHDIDTGKVAVFLPFQNRQYGIADSQGAHLFNFPVQHLEIVKEPARRRNQGNDIGGYGGDAVSDFIQFLIGGLIMIVQNEAVSGQFDLTVAFRQIEHLLLPLARARPVSFFRGTNRKIHFFAKIPKTVIQQGQDKAEQ